MSTPLSESRKRRVHSAGERVVLDALACIGTAVALFSVVKRQHEGFAHRHLAGRHPHGGQRPG